MTAVIATPPAELADADLLAAEREIAALRAQSDAFRAAGDHQDHDELWNQIWELEKKIAATPPTTLIGAAVKLRWLADPNLGIEAGPTDEDPDSIRQVLDLIEREAAPAAIRSAGGAKPTADGDPVVAMWAERNRLDAAASEAGEADDEDRRDELIEQCCAIDKRIARTRAHTVDGMLAQFDLLEWRALSFAEDDEDKVLRATIRAGLGDMHKLGGK
ncbi:MAG: hypothetical protein WB678_02165 [Stellaceae bacterium]